MSFHGIPFWYEIGSSDLDATAEFYGALLGWSVKDSGMPDFDYRLAMQGGDMVAGLTPDSFGQSGWQIYFAVNDCDAAAAAITAAGGTITSAPQDIPGTGRFAIALDPQGVSFCILDPDFDEMSPEQIAAVAAGDSAFSPQKPGHGAWNELRSPDPGAALGFYAALLGWTKGMTMDMGPMGSYQLVQQNAKDVGAIMGQVDALPAAWLPYFSLPGSTSEAIAQIKALGGRVHEGPMEVPGPAYVATAQDPHGHWFAVVSQTA